ncbi:MAG: peptidoglycan DD-metalloendopeptidase family protein [Sneathiellales bacterium]|nr:peptidoglycan DD-metalloendopeptidase family protein [Sneathiellales bacterium]
MGGLAAYAFLPADQSLNKVLHASAATVAESSLSSTNKETNTVVASLGDLSTPRPSQKPGGLSLTNKNPAAENSSNIGEKTVSIGRGDTLMKVLTKAGAAPQESHKAIRALSKVFDPRRLKIGQNITLYFGSLETSDTKTSAQASLVSVSLKQDVDRRLDVIRTPENSFKVRETVISLEKQMARAGGVIDNSLFLSAAKAGLPTSVTLDLIRIFSYDVDFQREIQTGDRFEVYFERFVDKDGKVLKEGRIQWASMTLSGTELSLYRYKTQDDSFTDYYTANGQSVRKTLMRTPIDGARLTSGFGKRRHPILGYTKMHKGTDFGARTGTPIMAAGNGTVERAGRNGAYGNYIRIRHNDTYKTAYAHMKGFAKGIRPGKRVKQGQIIGYVGSTGRSTGPHLHYEVIKNGRQINPMSVKLPAGRKLKGKMLTAFKRHTGKVDEAVAALPMEQRFAQLD